MKYLMFISFLIAVVINNHAKTEEQIKETAQNQHVEFKKGNMKAIYAAYKMHKEECLKENKDLQGKKLQECIVSKNK
jgi:competence protein ComGC